MPEEYPDHYVDCPFIDECGKKIDPSWEMRSYEGYIIWFDENMQFAHRHDRGFQPKRGNAIKNTRKKPKSTLRESELADALIESLENPGDPDVSHQAQVALIRALAPIIESGGGGATKAAEIAGEIIGEMFKAITPPAPGEKCRLCGRLDKPPVVRVSEKLVRSKWETGSQGPIEATSN